jgi:hypothetical protein
MLAISDEKEGSQTMNIASIQLPFIQWNQIIGCDQIDSGMDDAFGIPEALSTWICPAQKAAAVI